MNYMDESAVCPFYIEGDHLWIRCEGYGEGTRIRISFDCKTRAKSHAKKYCNCMKGFESCPMYPVIMKQYETKENDDETT